MQEVMKKVNELFDMLEAKNKETDAFDAKLRLQSEEQEKKAKSQAEKDVQLQEREAKVGKIENILEIESKNNVTLNKIMQEKESVATAANTHREQVAKDKSEIEIREKGVNDDFKTLKEGEAKLAEDQKKLEEDKKTYTKKIVEKIAGGIKV